MLTERGIELVLFMVEFLNWGSRYNPDGGPKSLLEGIKKNKKKAITELQDKLRSRRHTHTENNAIM
jgi:hypothetical protein